VIEGLILPKASGEELQHLQNHNTPLTQNEVLSLSNGLLNNLAQLALRGFVHGDIKPGNTFFNRDEGKVQFIDTGSLSKISKQIPLIPDTLFARNRPHTRPYTHPFLETFFHKAGFEQDLYSVGITILVADLRSKGQFEEARTLLEGLNQNNEQLRAGGKSYQQAKAQVLSLLDTAYPTLPAGDSPSLIGLRCVQESFHIIETAAPTPIPAVRRAEQVALIQNIRLGIPDALRTP
jgi:serine/threonine protein kinase